MLNGVRSTQHWQVFQRPSHPPPSPGPAAQRKDQGAITCLSCFLVPRNCPTQNCCHAVQEPWSNNALCATWAGQARAAAGVRSACRPLSGRCIGLPDRGGARPPAHPLAPFELSCAERWWDQLAPCVCCQPVVLLPVLFSFPSPSPLHSPL